MWFSFTYFSFSQSASLPPVLVHLFDHFIFWPSTHLYRFSLLLGSKFGHGSDSFLFIDRCVWTLSILGRNFSSGHSFSTGFGSMIGWCFNDSYRTYHFFDHGEMHFFRNYHVSISFLACGLPWVEVVLLWLFKRICTFYHDFRYFKYDKEKTKLWIKS